MQNGESSPAATFATGQSEKALVVARVDENRPKGLRFGLIIFALYLSVYLGFLDIAIVAPALPAITNTFKDTTKATWYFSIYLASNTAVQPVFGSFYRLTPKWTFLVSVLLFEIGSLLCGVAQSSELFIFGRAIAGVGAAGTYVGALTIIALICAPHEQAKYSNGVGALYTLGAVSGPLIGGAFTSHVTWRWCFFVNLPVGAVAGVVCFFFLKLDFSLATTESFKTRLVKCLKEVDWVGMSLFFSAIVELLFALQEGGLKSAWSSPKIIGCLAGSGATIIVLCFWVAFRGENGYVRPRLLKQRTLAVAIVLNFAIAGAYLAGVNVLSYYFQLRGSTSLRAGVQLLPLIAGVCTGLVAGGVLVPVLGFVNFPLLFGMVVLCIGTGLFALLDETTSTAMWAGLEILNGFGAGLSIMLPFVASQTVLAAKDIEIGTAMVLFSQTAGGALIFAVGQSWYGNLFLRNIQKISGLENAREMALAGVTAFRAQAPAQFIPQIEKVAIDALRHSYYIPAGILAASIVFAWPFLEWNSVKPPSKETDAAVSGIDEKISA